MLTSGLQTKTTLIACPACTAGLWWGRVGARASVTHRGRVGGEAGHPSPIGDRHALLSASALAGDRCSTCMSLPGLFALSNPRGFGVDFPFRWFSVFDKMQFLNYV